MFENTADLLSFILCSISIDFFIFHYWRKDGDRFDNESKYTKGTLSNYINCCYCHGFAVGALLFSFFGKLSDDLIIAWFHVIIAGLIISISTLTYRITVLKE